MKLEFHLFLDTSVLFAGIWSAEGGARMLLKLGESGVVKLFVSSQVLEELEDVIRHKAPDFLATLAVLLDRSQITIVPTASPLLFNRCKEFVPHAVDARILADAWHCHSEYLVTLDKVHFIDNPALPDQLPFLIGTPGDCLAWIRENLTGRDDY